MSKTRIVPLYGIPGPRWYVYRRGLRWMRSGFCPNCYSSPPQEECLVCYGTPNYGYDLLYPTLNAWIRRWDFLTRKDNWKLNNKKESRD